MTRNALAPLLLAAAALGLSACANQTSPATGRQFYSNVSASDEAQMGAEEHPKILAEFGGAYGPLPAQTMIPVLTLTDKDRVTGEDVSERTRLDPTEARHLSRRRDGWQRRSARL